MLRSRHREPAETATSSTQRTQVVTAAHNDKNRHGAGREDDQAAQEEQYKETSAQKTRGPDNARPRRMRETSSGQRTASVSMMPWLAEATQPPLWTSSSRSWPRQKETDSASVSVCACSLVRADRERAQQLSRSHSPRQDGRLHRRPRAIRHVLSTNCLCSRAGPAPTSP